MKIAMRLLDAVHFRCLNTRAAGCTVQKALPLLKRIRWLHESFRVVSVSIGQGLGLAPMSEARASACVSIYSGGWQHRGHGGHDDYRADAQAVCEY
jgi:hypothetical protein